MAFVFADLVPTDVRFVSGWFVASGAVSLLATAAVIRLASRLGVIDRPNERSSHERPTPRGGGVAIVLVGLLAIVAMAAIGLRSPTAGGLMLLGTAIISAVSGLDDVTSISARVRLLIHIVAAGIAVFAAGPVTVLDFGSFGTVPLGQASWVASVVWVVGMTNAFNFMDGIDGIAGITAVVVLGVLSCGLAIAGMPFLMLLSVSLAAASAGFLVWNWSPARIFMGDVGSAFLGYVIAVLPLAAGPEASSWLVPLTAFAMWPFLFDTVYTMVRRILKKENVLEAHRSHIYQRLVIAGMSHGAVTSLYGLLSVLAGGAALVARISPRFGTAAELAAFTAVTLGIVLLVVGVHVLEARADVQPSS